MKKHLLIFLAFSCFQKIYAKIYRPDTISLISKLQSFSTIYPTEKAYLHLDKPYYVAGDTIYFKAYVTMFERFDLSQISGILHVELINTTNKVDQGIKLKLVHGLAWGTLTLPDTLPAGNYRIRAYTRWMRNEGNYFEQTLPVGTVHYQRIPESSTARQKAPVVIPEIQFFAEGGRMVNGIDSKIAFKAIGINGLGVDVKGVIVDNIGKEITRFAASHLGMGCFYLTPEPGKTYTANITFSNGSENKIQLPLADGKGIALSVDNSSTSVATVKIDANEAYYKENRRKDYRLLIYSGGIASIVSLKLDSMSTNLQVIKRHLHTGITRITLFSAANEPLCERLLFIQNFDQLNFVIKTDRSVYAPRGKINIWVKVKDRADSIAMGHFSASVIDESTVPIDEKGETTILTTFLLTSDLKGTIEQPSYYFTNITDETLRNLDLVMLTHGYRKFEWKQVLTNSYPPPVWRPEKSLQISGLVENLFNKPLSKAPVSLISFDPKSLTSVVADRQGKFIFDNLEFTDSIKFVLQATTAKGGKYSRLIYNRDKPGPFIMPMPKEQSSYASDAIPVNYLLNAERQQEELNTLGLGKGRILKEVKIRGIKEDNQYETQSFAGAGHADQVMHADEIERIEGPLVASLNGRLHGIVFTPKGPFITSMGGVMLVVVDGTEVSGESLNYFSAEEVETVEVLKYANAAIYGMQGANGVLIVTTKKTRQLSPKDIASVGILPITVQGYYKIREYYSPKYETNASDKHPDLRSTVYWDPELVTDKDGNTSFSYYNADSKGSYRVVIEGIDGKGNLGRQIFRYKVE